MNNYSIAVFLLNAKRQLYNCKCDMPINLLRQIKFWDSAVLWVKKEGFNHCAHC